MPVFRNEKYKDYTVIDNKTLQDNDLSWKARGILNYLLSLPEDWDLHLSELEKHATDGESSLRSGVKELKEAGYIVYERINGEGGKFEHVYHVYERPYTENPDMDNPDMEKPDVDNRNLQSTNELSTDCTNTYIHDGQEIETIREAITKIWKQQPMQMNNIKILRLREYAQQLSLTVVCEAMKRAAYTQDPFYYLLTKKPSEAKQRALNGEREKIGLLNHWLAEDVTSISDIEKLDKQHERGGNNGKSGKDSRGDQAEKDYTEGAPDGFFV